MQDVVIGRFRLTRELGTKRNTCFLFDICTRIWWHLGTLFTMLWKFVLGLFVAPKTHSANLMPPFYYVSDRPDLDFLMQDVVIGTK